MSVKPFALCYILGLGDYFLCYALYVCYCTIIVSIFMWQPLCASQISEDTNEVILNLESKIKTKKKQCKRTYFCTYHSTTQVLTFQLRFKK